MKNTSSMKYTMQEQFIDSTPKGRGQNNTRGDTMPRGILYQNNNNLELQETKGKDVNT